MKFKLHCADNLSVLASMPDNSVDSIVTDPPYGLKFMAKKWDYDVPSVKLWSECLRVLKPGGHLISFAGARTHHRMTSRIEDAGFEIRDMVTFLYDTNETFRELVGTLSPHQLKLFASIFSADALLAWVYGSGFPKSAPVAKHIEALREGDVYTDSNGMEDVWRGLGTTLKPALEPITLARKPFKGTIARNVLAHGTGALNIDACRVASEAAAANSGRWPANVMHDGSTLVVEQFPQNAGAAAPVRGTEKSSVTNGIFGKFNERMPGQFYADQGSASRFFYCAKASPTDRHEGLDNPGSQFKHGSTPRMHENAEAEKKGNHHPTVKPTSLMAHLIRLVTPPGGVVLDPFMGSGSTGKACAIWDFSFIGIENEAEYFGISRARISFILNKRGMSEVLDED